MTLKFLKPLNNSLTLCSLFILAACGNPTATKEDSTPKDVAQATPEDTVVVVDEETYQHIALASIKDEMWDEYVAAMHNNIANSRQEPGNIIFTLFQPEDGTHQVAFMERFQNRTAFEEHLTADYLPEAITQKSLIGEMEIRTLKEVAEVPAVEPENADEVLTPRNIIVFFDVKPEERKTFVDAIAEVTKHSRAAEGNVRFNVFQQTDDENKFVLLESWESIAHHETHLAQEYSKVFDNAVTGVFVTNPMDSRLLATDISSIVE